MQAHTGLGRPPRLLLDRPVLSRLIPHVGDRRIGETGPESLLPRLAITVGSRPALSAAHTCEGPYEDSEVKTSRHHSGCEHGTCHSRTRLSRRHGCSSRRTGPQGAGQRRHARAGPSRYRQLARPHVATACCRRLSPVAANDGGRSRRRRHVPPCCPSAVRKQHTVVEDSGKRRNTGNGTETGRRAVKR
jgi:hypothetical protein